jgi:LPS sulfotransferase NodH
MSPAGAPAETQELHRPSVRSAEWDLGNGNTPRIKYVIFSLPRVGSVYLCSHLRRRGIGIPLEYLGASSIADRLGCRDSAGNTPLGPYFAQLFDKRTTPNGIFGIKIHPVHLRSFAQDDIEAAADFFRAYDRVLVLRRRDKLLQAISLVRARATQQFTLWPKDAERTLTLPDNALFAAIATELASIVSDEHYMKRVLARIDLSKVRAAWYEELSETVVDQIAAWLGTGAEPIDVTRQPYAGHPLPRRGNTEEALALKTRFLDHITGQTD